MFLPLVSSRQAVLVLSMILACLLALQSSALFSVVLREVLLSFCRQLLLIVNLFRLVVSPVGSLPALLG